MKQHKKWMLALTVLAVTGCSTYYNKTFQKLAIHTPGVENVECNLQTPKNRYRAIAPMTINVERSPYEMTIVCEKAGYLSQTDTLVPEVSAEYVGLNVANNAIIGTAYDIASKSIYQYPDAVVIHMEPDPDRIVVHEDLRYQLRKKGEPAAVQVAPRAIPKDTKVKEAVSESAKK